MENGTKHSTTKIVTDDKLKKYQRKKTLKSWRLLDNEAEEGDLLELDLEKTKIMDSLPVHIGNSILMHSKLHFLRFDSRHSKCLKDFRFIKFLRDYLRPGSYKLCYADTG